ncbi:MAG: glycosyltransferase [Candidatus Paceibacterota bacterium]
MNVLIIGTTDVLGGAAKVSWELKEALEAQGNEVSMFVADKRSSDHRVHVIPRPMWRKYLGFLLGTESLISTDWILDTEEFKKADLVHCHNLHGRYFNLSTLQKMSLTKPVVWTLHDEWALTPHCAYTLEGTEMKNGLYVCPSIDTAPRILWDNSARLARARTKIYAAAKLHIVTPSKWLMDRTLKTILAKQDVRLIPNGIDTTGFVQKNKAEARRALNLPEDKKIILFLANDAKDNTWKGWVYTERLIQKYRDRDDVLFLCVGNLRDHEPEPNVRYVGHVSGAENLSQYYSAADALLFTSIAENFPLVILEAMSCGLPIVSFDVGGVAEAVTHHENGYVAGYKDEVGIAQGIEWVLTLSLVERERIASASSNKVRQEYDKAAMVERYFALYTELLGHG